MKPEEFMAHAGFVRSLARSLVLDEHAAADLSQAAWVSMLEHPPAVGKPIRAWLAKVIQNFAVTRLRRESRLKRREQTVSRPEGIPSAGEIVEKMEIRRLLIDAVLRLDDPYRSTIVLRYYEGLSSREIAERLGIPLETVRTREKRGLAKLKEQLDSLYGDEQKSLCLALASLAGIRFASPAAGAKAASEGLLAGVLAMTTKMKAFFIAAAALLLVSGVILFFPFDTEENKEKPLEFLAAVAEDRTSESLDSGSASPGELREPVLPGEQESGMPGSYLKALCGLSGRVLDLQGAPVPGKRVELFGIRPIDFFQGLNILDKETAPRLELDRKETVSAGDGTFLLTGIFPRAYYVLTVDRGGEQPAACLVDALPDPGCTRDLGDIVLEPCTSITGRVMDEEGNPLEGVRVRATQLPPLIFSLGVQDVRAGCSVLFEHDPLFYKKCVVEPPPAAFELLSLLPIPTALTGRDGTFHLQGVPLGPVTVVADREGLASCFKPFIPSPKKTEQDLGALQMGHGETFRGRIVDQEGCPVPGVEVRVGPVYWNQDWSLLRQPVFTDQEGTFSVSGLPPLPVYLAMRRHPGDTFTIEGPCSIYEERVVQGPPCYDLRIKVVNEDHAPVEEAELRVRERSLQNLFPSHRPVPLDGRVERGEAGILEVKGLSPGRYELVVIAEGYGPSLEAVTIKDRPLDMEVELRPGYEALVRVVDGESRAPLRWAEVFVKPAGRRPGKASTPTTMSDRTFTSLGEFFLNVEAVSESGAAPWYRNTLGFSRMKTGAEGLARFPCLSPGRYAITVSHPGYAVALAALEVPLKSETLVAMKPGGAIQGKVRFEGSNHQPPFAVVLETGDESAFPELWMPRLTLTDPKGGFRVENLDSGEWKAKAMKRLSDKGPMGIFRTFAEGSLGSGGARVRPGETAELEIRLADSRPALKGRLSGLVTINGMPAGSAWVSLHVGGKERSASVGANGYYGFEDLPPGRAVVKVSIPAGPDQQLPFDMAREIQVEEGLSYLEDFIILTGALFGGVTHHGDGTPAAGVEVMAWTESGGPDGMETLLSVFGKMKPDPRNLKVTPDSGLSQPVRMKTVTGPDGSFRFDRVPAGQYRVRARAAIGESTGSRVSPASTARSIEVLPSASAGPVDLSLYGPVTVEGRVELPEGEGGISGMMLLVFSPDHGNEGAALLVSLSMDSTEINSSRLVRVDPKTGAFVIPAILPGSYMAVVLPLGPSGSPRLKSFKALSFHVPPEGLSNLVLRPEEEKREE